MLSTVENIHDHCKQDNTAPDCRSIVCAASIYRQGGRKAAPNHGEDTVREASAIDPDTPFSKRPTGGRERLVREAAPENATDGHCVCRQER